MGMLAWLFGFIGGLCMLMGIVTVTKVASLGGEFTWMFWFVLSALLLLMSIAFATGSSRRE